MPDRASTPEVAASLLNGLRRSLIDASKWAEVETYLLERDPEARAWLQQAERAEWISAHQHVRAVDAIGAVLGEAELRRFGSEQLQRDMASGALAPVLRSWARSFGRDPAELMRVVPHAWQAVMRGLGRWERVREEPGFVEWRLQGEHGLLIGSRAWQLFLSGFATALLHLAGRGGDAEMAEKDGAVSLIARWPDAR